MPFLSRGGLAQAAWPSRQIRMLCSYPGGRADRPAGARLRRVHLQAGRANRRHRKQGRRLRLDRRRGSRALGAGRTHHPVLDLDHLCDEPGDDEKPGYDMDKDLALVSVIPGAGLPLVASVKSGVKSLADFVAFARQSGKVNFGTYSAGSSPHMTIHELNKQYASTSSRSITGAKRRCGRASRKARSMPRWAATPAHNRCCKRPRRRVRRAFEEGRRDARCQDAAEQGATSKFFTVSGFTGWALPKASPQPIVDRLAALSSPPTAIRR